MSFPGNSAVIDVAWSAESPLPDCPQIAGLVAFYQERLDVIVDGVPGISAAYSLVAARMTAVRDTKYDSG